MGQRKVASRSAQWPLLAEFVLNFDDTMVDTTGAVRTLGNVGSAAFDIIPLPPGAIVQGGEVVTEVAFVGSTAMNISIGDAGIQPQPPNTPNPTRYLGATDKTTAARTPLVPTGYVGQGENIRMTVNPTVANATAGRLSVKIWYVIRDRANEVNPT